MKNPTWWTEKHEGAWDRVKGAMKRDWEQTKADFTSKPKRHDLAQEASDTVKQIAGKEPIPPDGVPNRDWDAIEPEYRYGVGARHQYGADHSRWDERLEGKLASDWNELDNEHPWDDVKPNVRRAFERDDSSK